MSEYPISSDRAEQIRADFAARAADFRARVAALSPDDPMAGVYAEQAASWERMAVRPFETMRLAGTF